MEELRDALARERAGVGCLEPRDELLLAGGVPQRDALGLLVAVQLADELEPAVDRRQQVVVGGGDPLAVAGDSLS